MILDAAYKLNEAVGIWNAVKFGTQFRWVKDLKEAEFVLAYGGGTRHRPHTLYPLNDVK